MSKDVIKDSPVVVVEERRPYSASSTVIALPLPIETSRLRLRSLLHGDRAALHAIQSRADVARWLYWEPRSEDEVREALERQIARARDAPETGVALAVEVMATGDLIGHVSLTLGPPEHLSGRDRVHVPPGRPGPRVCDRGVGGRARARLRHL